MFPCFQSSQATFHEQHLESGLDFGDDLMMIDDTDDVDEDINGIQHLFDEWNESKLSVDSDCEHFFIIFSLAGAVGMPQASPTRDTHGGSPMTMDDNKGRQSPGMADSQNGQSRNMYSTQESEEVSQFHPALDSRSQTSPCTS